MSMPIAYPAAAGLRAVFFDLDGTLVSAAGTLSPGVRNAVAALQRRGISVGLATGRPLFGCEKFIEELKISAPSLFFSGALLLQPGNSPNSGPNCGPDSGRILAQTPISSSALQNLLVAARAADLYCELYTKEDYFVEAESHLREMHYFYLKRYPQHCDLLDLAGRADILKAVLITDNAESEKRLRRISTAGPELHCAYSTGATHPEVLFGNITSPNCSRERAFELLLTDLQLRPEEVAAFGDAEADLPFLRLAGCGVAMGNAPEAVRRAAPYQTRSVEDDGVPYALETLGLLG